MMHHPDVQAKVHAELDSVANGRKYIDMNDRVSFRNTNGYRTHGHCEIFSHILLKCFSQKANTTNPPSIIHDLPHPLP